MGTLEPIIKIVEFQVFTVTIKTGPQCFNLELLQVYNLEHLKRRQVHVQSQEV